MNWKTIFVAGAILLSGTFSAQAAAQEIDVLWLKQNVPCNWGLAVGPDDSVYCVSPFGAGPTGPGVVKFDSSGNQLMTWGAMGSDAGEFMGPRGVAVDSLGLVYVADEGNHRIQQFSSNGTFNKIWGNDVLSGSGIAGSFEVCIAGQTCYSGVANPSGFTWPHDLAIDPRDDTLVVADTFAPRVVRLNPVTNELTELYNTCEFDDCMQILSVAVDSSGSLFLTLDFNNIARYDYEAVGGYTQTWLRDLGDGNPPTAHYVSLDSLGNVYVSDEQNHRIHQFDSDGNPIMIWGWGVDTGAAKFEVCTSTSGCLNGRAWDYLDLPNEGQFMGPIGIAVDSQDDVLVVDGGDRLQKFGHSSATDGIIDLVATVIALNLNGGMSNSLDAKLSSVLNALEDANLSNDVAALNGLQAFINAVEAQRGKKVSETDADQLIELARQIIGQLNS
jgi:hypothetical protein